MNTTDDGSLYIGTETDLTELYGALAETERRIKGLSNASAAEAEKISKSISAFTEGMLKQQRKLIEEIEEEIKGLRSELVKTFSIKDINSIEARLTEAKSRRAQAERVLMEMEEKKIEVSHRDETAQKSIIGSLGKWAVGLFSVTAALKVAKDIMNSTAGTAETLEETISLLKGGFQGLFRTIATGDWSNLIRNIRDTAEASRDLRRETNELKHITAGNEIKRSELFLALQESREMAAGSKDPAEKQKYIREAIEFQQQLTELNLSEKKKQLRIDEEYYKTLTGHGKEYYDYLLERIPVIAKNYEGLYSQVEGYQLRLKQLADKEKLNGKWRRDADGEAVLVKSALTEQEKEERHQLQLLLVTLQDYKTLQEDLSKKGQWDEYIRGIAEMIRISGEGERSLVGLTNQLTEAQSQAALGVMDLNKQIEAETERLTQAIVSRNDEEVRSIAVKLSGLRAELEMRERIARQVVSAAGQAAMGPIKPAAIISGSLKPSVKPAVKRTGRSWEEIANEMTSLAGSSKGWASQQQVEIEKNIARILEKQLVLRDQIVSAAGDLVYMLSQATGIDQETASFLNSTMDSIQKAIAGDYLGAALSMLNGVLEKIPNRTEAFNKKIEQMNRLLEEQERLIARSDKTGGGQALLESQLDQQKKIMAEYEKELEHWEYKLRHSQGGVNYGNRKEMVEYYSDLVYQSGIAIEETKQQLADLVRGADIERNIADALIQGMEAGKVGVKDFGEFMSQVLKQAVTASFVDGTLLPAINKEFIPMLDKALDNNSISKTEMEDLTKWMGDTAKLMEPLYNNLASVFNSSVSNTSLSGAIKGITEQTASVLAGQVTGIRISQSEVNATMRQQLLYLSEIAGNTRYNKHLESIDNKLGALNSDPLRAQGIIGV